MRTNTDGPVRVVGPDDLEADESTPGVARATVFQSGNAVVVRSRVEAGTTSGWHHHGERDAYGYVVTGSGRVEYGPGERERADASAGEFFSIEAGAVHRDVNPGPDDAIVLVCFVGGGPVVVNVDGPGGA